MTTKGNPTLSNKDIAALNKLSPELGNELSRIFVHLGNRADAQEGHQGPVGVAGMLDLGDNRLTGVADPKDNADLVSLGYARRTLKDCDKLMDILDDCLEVPQAGEAAPVTSPELFPPNGFLLFADTPQTFVYYLRRTDIAFGSPNDERVGAIGAIDIADKHAPFRTDHLVLTRNGGPIWFAVDEERLIGFVYRIIQSNQGAVDDFYLGAVDLSDPTALNIIGLAFFAPPINMLFDNFPQIHLGNKGDGDTTFGYLNAYVAEFFHPFLNNTYVVEVWNLTNPTGVGLSAGMVRVRRYALGGYFAGAPFPISSDFGIHGSHWGFCTDDRGTSIHAVNVSAGDINFNFTGRSAIFLNHWDISDPADMLFLGRVELGLGVELSGLYKLLQTQQVVMWGTSVFALVTIYDPEISSFPLRHLFGIDCSEAVPVIKTDMIGPCGEFDQIAIHSTCLTASYGFTDVLFDVSDLSNFRLIGGCDNFFPTGYQNYRPGNLYSITQSSAQSPGDPTLPRLGFVINYLGENGIDCP